MSALEGMSSVFSVVRAKMIGMSRFAAIAAILLTAASPAAAEQSRATLSVSAVVLPSCLIDGRAAGAQNVACSTGERVPAATIAHRGEKPLDAAAAMLGAPARGARGVEFTAPLRPTVDRAAQPSEDKGATRYLTLTY